MEGYNDPNLMVTQLFRPKKSVVLVCQALNVEPPPACLTLWHRLKKTTERLYVPMDMIYDNVEVPNHG